MERGDPAPAPNGRYTILRYQGSQACVSHDATVIPIKGCNLMGVSYYDEWPLHAQTREAWQVP